MYYIWHNTNIDLLVVPWRIKYSRTLSRAQRPEPAESGPGYTPQSNLAYPKVHTHKQRK